MTSLSASVHRVSHCAVFYLAVLCLPANAAPASATEGPIKAGQTVSYPLPLAEGDFVRGAIEGGKLRVTLIDAGGAPVRRLTPGQAEREDFMFVAGAGAPYRLKVHAAQAGNYRLTFDDIIPKAAQVAPATLESPRLEALRRQLEQGGNSAAFWSEMQTRGTPLVELDGVSPPLADGSALLTFLWRGARDNVMLLGAPSGDRDRLQRLGQSDVWYLSYRVPRSSRIVYRLAPDVPQLNLAPGQQWRGLVATAQRDPLNRLGWPEKPVDHFDGMSLVELPEAPPQPWLARRPGVAAGSVSAHRVGSKELGNTRDVYLYRPAGYRAGAEGNALLVLFDGDDYQQQVPTPTILDNMIAAGVIPPTAAILIGNPSLVTRGQELPPNPHFASFLAKELMPWARQQGIYAPAASTVIAGSSYGGLSAAYNGLQHPELFGKVFALSGSFWWQPGGRDANGAQEQGWLTREFVAAPRQPLAFYMEAGLFETGARGTDIINTSRHLRDVLRAKGYPVQYAEYASGHDYMRWRGSLSTGLIALLGQARTPAESATAGAGSD